MLAVEQDILLFSITIRGGRVPQVHLTTEPATGTERLRGSSRSLLDESHERIRVDKNKGTVHVRSLTEWDGVSQGMCELRLLLFKLLLSCKMYRGIDHLV